MVSQEEIITKPHAHAQWAPRASPPPTGGGGPWRAHVRRADVRVACPARRCPQLVGCASSPSERGGGAFSRSGCARSPPGGGYLSPRCSLFRRAHVHVAIGAVSLRLPKHLPFGPARSGLGSWLGHVELAAQAPPRRREWRPGSRAGRAGGAVLAERRALPARPRLRHRLRPLPPGAQPGAGAERRRAGEGGPSSLSLAGRSSVLRRVNTDQTSVNWEEGG